MTDVVSVGHLVLPQRLRVPQSWLWVRLNRREALAPHRQHGAGSHPGMWQPNTSPHQHGSLLIRAAAGIPGQAGLQRLRASEQTVSPHPRGVCSHQRDLPGF